MDGAIVQSTPDGKILYRASGLASCTKALVAARLGFEPLPPPPEVAARFREGHDHEDLIVRWLAERGTEVVDREMAVELRVTDKVSVVGHIDGRTRNRDGVVEMKSQSQDAWDDFARRGWESGFFPKYKWQVSVYIQALKASYLKLVRKNRNTGEHRIEIVWEPFYSVADIRARVLRVEALARAQEPPSTCDQKDYPCPYVYLHEGSGEVELLDDPAIDLLAREYSEAATEEKLAKSRKESIRKALHAAAKGGKLQTVTGTKVTFYSAKNPPQVDKQRLNEVLKDRGETVEDNYMTTSMSERLRVTLPTTTTKEGS